MRPPTSPAGPRPATRAPSAATSPAAGVDAPPAQLSFDDLGTPLSQVTFCVVDVETTGASPGADAITEVAAVKFRGGERLGTLETLVNPGTPIPPTITYLTGITQAMVLPAPAISAVLPSLLEFVGDAVIVGHNVRFDLRFLDAALTAHDYPRLANRWVDTCRLSRRLVHDETPDHRLATLAHRFRLPNRPCHRAMPDVLATADLLHFLLERAAAWGVLGLDDLVDLPRIHRHPHASKLRLTTTLPRSPGVYLFVGRDGEVLYVGKATNLRSRVRSYFGSDDRRTVGPLLRDAAAVRHVECATAVEAAVLELRLIQRFLPRYNRASTQWPKYAYVRVGGTAGRPKVTTTADPAARAGEAVLGPIPSRRIARDVVTALQGARTLVDGACPLAGLVTGDPRPLLDPLAERMRELAGEERFEEAAVARDLGGALARAVEQQRRTDALRRAGRLRLRWRGHVLLVEDGRLRVDVDPAVLAGLRGTPAAAAPDAAAAADPTDVAADGPLPRWLVDEVVCLATWLERHGSQVRVEHADTGLAAAATRLPRFTVVERDRPRSLPEPATRGRGAIATSIPLHGRRASVP